MAERSEKFRANLWKPGQSGNPAGSKKGTCCGRMAALKNLDAMLSEAGNAEKLRAAMQAEFDRNPMRFFKNVVMPLLPKESINRLEGGERVIEWRSLLTVSSEDVTVSKPPFPEEVVVP